MKGILTTPPLSLININEISILELRVSMVDSEGQLQAVLHPVHANKVTSCRSASCCLELHATPQVVFVEYTITW